MTASMLSARVKLSLVVPACNEAEGIEASLWTLERCLASIDCDGELVVVNDGSSDDTLARVHAFASAHLQVVVVDLSRNFGKEAALSAGLEVASGDVVIPLDADLQDPPELIPRMLELWRQGAEVVLAKRVDRRSDGWLKRNTASAFYRLMNRVSDVPIPENVGDFRLMDRCVVDTLLRLPENRRFMKGLFAWAGFRTAEIEYVRPARHAGESKFNILRLVNLAVEGITSFSTAPLRLATYVGFVVACLAFAYGAFIVLRTLIQGVDVPGYASLLSAVLFMSGLQLMALGVIGEYVGRTYLESKRRPAYVIRRVWRREPGAASEQDEPLRDGTRTDG